jgi:hypothetical protein
MAKHFYDTSAAVKHYHAVISLRSDHTASYEIRNRADVTCMARIAEGLGQLRRHRHIDRRARQGRIAVGHGHSS